MTENEGKKIKRREIEIISFICNTHCPFCKNNKCNAEQIMLKYDTIELTHAQAKEIT
jgi:glutaredoxin